jgi:dCTP deaminase
MILCDSSIRKALDSGWLKCDPAPSDEQIQPASLDLRLSGKFKRFSRELSAHSYVVNISTFDAKMGMVDTEIAEGGFFRIKPNEFWLASTVEYVTLPADLLGTLHGRSSLARLGLIIHSAGYIDPGFSGTITLELANVGPHTLEIPIGWRIGQLSFELLDHPAEKPYGVKPNSKYQGQVGPTESKSRNDRNKT